MTSKNIRFFHTAKNIAKLSDYKRVNVGCVAVQGNRVLSTGFNSTKSHPLQAHYNKFRKLYGGCTCNHSLHAEIACLVPLWDSEIDWSKVDLYVYRLRRDIEHGMSRPCPACLAAIKALGIKNVYYTTNDGYAHEEIS